MSPSHATFRRAVAFACAALVLIPATATARTLVGTPGKDRLKGGKGKDKLFGGAGNDRLYRDGADLLRGGGGKNSIVSVK